jgi:hypothetical protein
MGFFMSVSRESNFFFQASDRSKIFYLAISFSQQAQSWNICMPNISNAKKKKNPGDLYLTFFTDIKNPMPPSLLH